MEMATKKMTIVQLAFRSLAILLMISATSCGPSASDTYSAETKRDYQLCPESEDARAGLIDLARSFAAQHSAQLSDRGSGAQSELAAIAPDTLQSTSLPLVLLTIEKPKRFRISLTNAGLREKFVLSVRLWETRSADTTNALLNDLKRSWRIEEVQGGVRNDPPCSTF
jgi:hypothetical protein